MLKGEEMHARRLLGEKIKDILAGIGADDLATLPKFWKSFNGALKRLGLGDVFAPPDGIKVGNKIPFNIGDITPERLPLSDTFLKNVRERADMRIRESVDRSYSLASGSSSWRRLRLAEALERVRPDGSTHGHRQMRAT
jgi:hypothetical protein